ncbi:formation of crista junctions protein 1 [Striga asiatica]|uniref:Formation of crista junctions protein 1 n=1 Tax=Striga asiatica TaxID=4170 RepID=A0A5A7QYE2_STRAF|nr:formation of crista junctions protein 1 [Striga asiatica]
MIEMIPSYLSSRRLFSASSSGPHKPDTGNSGDVPKSSVPKILSGGLALGSVFLVVYYSGALDSYIDKRSPSISEFDKARLGYSNTQTSPEQPKADEAREISESIDRKNSQESDVSSSDSEHVKQDVETQADVSIPENFTTEEDKSFQAKDTTVQTSENVNTLEGTDVSNAPQSSSISVEAVTSEPAEVSVDLSSSGAKPYGELVKAIETGPDATSEDKTTADIEMKSVPSEQTTIQGVQEGDAAQRVDSLLDDYCLTDDSGKQYASSSEKLKDISSGLEDVRDGYITKDGKLILDFLQAIHAAEERQAELDARTYSEEKRAIKEKYEKELRDARVRELMYAEREAILDKELTRERIKAAAALKSLQEKLEEKLRTELEQKEMEVEQKLKQMRDIAKAELAAAIASEKASQIEKMAEANLNINALCMAFYARSEEARQSHSVHKLALGALALEDALSKGLPVQKEIEALHTHLEDIDKDSLVEVVLSSLPEDTKKYGTDTQSQYQNNLLSLQFDGLKSTLRHYSLIPPGGGGILSHSLAYIASWLKFKEVDQSGEGIESIISRVESLLAQGKLCEAADTLENGLEGSQAAEVVNEWVRKARERAVTEQALTVLQSYATSISLT